MVTWKALGSVEVVDRACCIFLQIVFIKTVMNEVINLTQKIIQKSCGIEKQCTLFNISFGHTIVFFQLIILRFASIINDAQSANSQSQ